MVKAEDVRITFVIVWYLQKREEDWISMMSASQIEITNLPGFSEISKVTFNKD